ncbi:unnamed protein product, partial [Mesorhabditis spiculigera]
MLTDTGVAIYTITLHFFCVCVYVVVIKTLWRRRCQDALAHTCYISMTHTLLLILETTLVLGQVSFTLPYIGLSFNGLYAYLGIPPIYILAVPIWVTAGGAFITYFQICLYEIWGLAPLADYYDDLNHLLTPLCLGNSILVAVNTIYTAHRERIHRFFGRTTQFERRRLFQSIELVADASQGFSVEQMHDGDRRRSIVEPLNSC